MAQPKKVSSSDAADILEDRGQPWNDPSLKPKKKKAGTETVAKSESSSDDTGEAEKLEKRQRGVAKAASPFSEAFQKLKLRW